MAFERGGGASPEERFSEALAQATSLVDELEDLKPPAIAELLRDRANVRSLIVFLERGLEWAARDAAETAAIEKGRREQEQTRYRELIGRFNRTGDPAILDELPDEAARAEAHRQHEVVRRTYENAVERVLGQVRTRRMSPQRARFELSRMTGLPSDFRAEAEAEIDSLTATAA